MLLALILPLCYQENSNYVPTPLLFDPNSEKTYERFCQQHENNYGSEGEPAAPPPEFFFAMMAEMFNA